MISFEIFKQEKCQPPLLRRPAPAPYSHPLFEFFRTTPHPPAPSREVTKIYSPPLKMGGGRCGGPNYASERKRWRKAFPITPTKNIVVCVQHWPVNCKMYKKKGHQLPVDKTSIFSSPKSFFRQSLDAPLRNLERCNLFRSLGWKLKNHMKYRMTQ